MSEIRTGSGPSVSRSSFGQKLLQFCGYAKQLFGAESFFRQLELGTAGLLGIFSGFNPILLVHTRSASARIRQTHTLALRSQQRSGRIKKIAGRTNIAAECICKMRTRERMKLMREEAR